MHLDTSTPILHSGARCVNAGFAAEFSMERHTDYCLQGWSSLRDLLKKAAGGEEDGPQGLKPS